MGSKFLYGFLTGTIIGIMLRHHRDAHREFEQGDITFSVRRLDPRTKALQERNFKRINLMNRECCEDYD